MNAAALRENIEIKVNIYWQVYKRIYELRSTGIFLLNIIKKEFNNRFAQSFDIEKTIKVCSISFLM